jgi:putative tricarboxylic transport membrane protein
VSEATSTSHERRPDRAALVIGLILIGIAATVAWDAFSMRAGAASYSRIGPKAFPYAVSFGLLLLGVLTGVQALREEPAKREPLAFTPVFWIVGGLGAQIALLPYAGFSLATGAVFAATAKAFGRGPLWLTYPIGVGIALSVWLFFSKALQLILPAGPLENLF